MKSCLDPCQQVARVAQVGQVGRREGPGQGQKRGRQVLLSGQRRPEPRALPSMPRLPS